MGETIEPLARLNFSRKEKQASAIVLSLEGKAQTAALQVPSTELVKDTGVETLIAHLDKIFLKDKLSLKFDAIEAFETYKRPELSSVKEFVEEFERKYQKVETYGIKYPEDITQSKQSSLVGRTLDQGNYHRHQARGNQNQIVKSIL